MANVESLVFEITGRDKSSKAFDSVTKSVNQSKQTVDNLIKSMKQHEAAIGLTGKQLVLHKAQIMGATEAQRREIAETYDAIQAKKKLAAQTGALNQQFRFMRGGMGQVGHQIQDVVVQAQMGTNAFLILGQQGSQVASLFGPHGALLGALLAVGAAFGTYLTSSRDVQQSTKELSSEVGELADEYERASKAMRLLMMPDLLKQQRALEKSIDDLKIKIKVNAETMTTVYNGASEQMKKRQQELQEENRQLVIELQDHTETLADLNTIIDGSTASTQDLISGLEEELATLGATNRVMALHEAFMSGATQADYDRINSIYDKIEAYEAEQEQIKDLARQEQDRLRNEAKAARDAAREKEKQLKAEERALQKVIDLEARRRQAKLDAQFEEESKVFDNLAALEESFQNEIELIRSQEAEKNAVVREALDIGLLNEQQAADARKRIAQEASNAIRGYVLSTAQSVISTTANQVSQLGSFFDQASGIGKAFFVVSQTIAAADAIIKGLQASMSIRAAYFNMASVAGPGAAALIAAGEVHANAAKVMGVATAAAIMGQTAASFEGGGFTGSGVRSGGMDGKGGFPAILHPNESVIDHTRGGGGIVVHQTINVSTGVQQTVRAEIANMLPSITQATKAAVADSKMRGGSYSRAMGG